MSVADKATEFELRDYLRVVWKRRNTIILSAAVVVAVSLAASFLQTPVYATTSEVLLQPRIGDTLFDPNTGQVLDATRAVDTEIKILKSQPVRDAVRAELGRAPDVQVQAAGKTNVIEVTGESTDPEQAVAIANSYARSYIDFRKKQQVDDLLSASKEIQSKITELQAQADAAAGPLKQTLIDQQALFKQKLDQLEVDAALKTGGAQLVTEASLPEDPIKPTPVKTAILALVAGALLGLALAFLIDYLDDSVKNKDDLGRIAPEVPVIGLIPAVPDWKATDEAQVVSLLDPGSPASEAYRTLRTSIQFLGLDRPIKTLQITSASAQEGKTTTLSNLAVALARAGQNVVIVCCDLRRPRVHEFFGLENTTGFTSVLLGRVPLTAAVQPVPSQPRLSVLSAGPLPPNPSELLSSQRTVEVLTSLQSSADMVLVDSPPILPVTDSLIISGRVDATLLVAVAGATTKKDAARAVELLEQVEAPLVGTVLNGVTADGAYGYDYGYYRYESLSGDANGKQGRQPKPASKSARQPAQNT